MEIMLKRIPELLFLCYLWPTSNIWSLNLWRNWVKSVIFPMINSGMHAKHFGVCTGRGSLISLKHCGLSLTAKSDNHVDVAIWKFKVISKNVGSVKADLILKYTVMPKNKKTKWFI